MTRSVFYRVKSPQGPWQRATGTAPFNITGLTNGVPYEVDPGNGSLINVVLTAADLELTFETTSANEVFIVPMRNTGTYSATMNIDGGPDIAITAYNDADLTQTIPTAGIHTLRMRGKIGGLYFSSDPTMSAKLRTVQNVGQLSHGTLQGAFSDSTGLTSLTFGNTDAGSATNWSFLTNGPSAGSAGPATIDFTGVDMSSVLYMSGAFKNNVSLTSVPGLAAAFATAAPEMIDEMFRNCPGLEGADIDLSGMDITNFRWIGSNPLTGGAFDVITPTATISQAMWDKTLLAWEAQTSAMTVDRIPLGFGVSPYTTGGAVEAARTALINRGYWITDAGNQVPDTPDAPTATAVSGGFSVTFPAAPFGHGRHVTAWDVRYSDDGGGIWVESIDFTDGGTISVPDGTYFVQVRAKNFDGASAWSASDSVTVTASQPVIVTEEGGEPIFTIDGSVADAVTVNLDIAGTTYTTDYLGTTLTAGMLRAGAVWLTRPLISGLAEEGATLTVTPGKIVYTGDDPGDQTWAWVNNTDGALSDTNLSYMPDQFDVGDTLRVDETYNGVTVSSLRTDTIVSGIVPANAFAVGQWSVAKGHDSKIDVTISALPIDNGTPIIDVLYELDGSGTWTSIPGYNGLGTYPIIVPKSNASYDIKIRAYNGRQSADSDIKTETSGDVPQLVSSLPIAGELSYAPADNITLTFDQPIQFGDAEITLREDSGRWGDREVFVVSGPTSDVGTGDGTISISGNVLTINPTLAMADGGLHAIRIASTAIQSMVGNNFAGILDDTALSFTASSTPFNPATWFAGGVKGLVIDTSDISTLYQNNDLTSQVTASGQTVRSISDKSGNNWHLYEPAGSTPGIGVYTEANGQAFINFTDGALRPAPDNAVILYDVFIGVKKTFGTSRFALFGTDSSSVFAGYGVDGQTPPPDNAMGTTGTVQYFINDGPALVSPSRDSYYDAIATGTELVAIIENPSLSSSRRMGIGYQSGTSIAGAVYCAVVIESAAVDATKRAQIIAYIQGKF